MGLIQANTRVGLRNRGLGRGGSRKRGGELGRGLKTERAMRPPVVVVVLPASGDHPRVTEATNNLQCQALVTESNVEANVL